MAFAQDILTRIIDIHIPGGLAVEFRPDVADDSTDDGTPGEPSYVRWQGPPLNMSKGTISMWFRVPQETIDNFEREDDLAFAPLQNLIPILAFSGQPSGPWTEMYRPVINTFYFNANTDPDLPPDYQPAPYHGFIPGPTWDFPYHPCMIGIHIDSEGGAHLAVVLQTSDVGVPANTTTAVVAADGVIAEGGPEEGLLFGPTDLHYENASAADAKLDWFDHNYGAGPEVEADKWHHVLLSWDLQGSNQSHGDPTSASDPPGPSTPLHEFFTAKSLMYCALDDENLTGNDLPTQYWTDGFGDNEIACWSCWHLAGAPYNSDHEAYYGFPQYTVTFEQGIQMDKVAVPSQPEYDQWTMEGWTNAETVPTYEIKIVEPIQKIEVAELQIFADVLLDTGDESNRRVFIDADGKPVSPNEGATEDDPSGAAEKLLGKKPEFLLHGSSNWKRGKNTGSLADEGSTDDPGGQFEAIPIIKTYKPDPSLHGPQSPEEIP